MDTPTTAPTAPNEPPKTWSVTFSFSWHGPGMPSQERAREFFKSLSRKDLALAAGVVVLLFVIEPLFCYWVFSAKLSSQLQSHTASVTESVSGVIQSQVGTAVREAMERQRPATPLNVPDPTSLVLPSNGVQTSPPPVKPK